MNRLNLYDISIDDNFKAVKSGLHKEKRRFMEDNEVSIKGSWNDYDAKMHSNPCRQNELTQLWEMEENDTASEKDRKQKCRDISYDLYGSDRPFVNKHMERLTAENGGDEIVCPICGIKLWDEVDHHIPRALFPEFSGLCYNLIPLCHDCNHEKSDLWLDANGNRLIFNAFVDGECDDFLVSSLSIVNELPKITLSLANGIAPIILSTMIELKLIRKYQREADKQLRTEVHKLEKCFSHSRNATMELWALRKSEYLDWSADTFFNIVCRLVYNEIATSAVFERWLINEMNVK